MSKSLWLCPHQQADRVKMSFNPILLGIWGYILQDILTNMFYCSIYWECHHPNWLSCFSEGLAQPPTRCSWVMRLLPKSIGSNPFPKKMAQTAPRLLPRQFSWPWRRRGPRISAMATRGSLRALAVADGRWVQENGAMKPAKARALTCFNC